MNDKYKKIMDKINVSQEMHERVMNNICSASIQPKRILFPRKIAAIAACAVVLAAGVAGIAVISSQNSGTTLPPTLYQDTKQYSNAADLSSVLGFDVVDLSGIPFKIDETVYSVIYEKTAEINYYGKNGESLTYRVSRGSIDNSEHFVDLDREDVFDANGKNVTLKGTSEGYTIAVWQQNSLSYSISISYPANSETLLSMIK